MKKTDKDLFGEKCLHERLDNGLEVWLFHRPERISTTMAFGTPYGALKINQRYEGREYHFNPGIAHFLEHKLFETDEKDIMNEFSAMGANVNAFTSHKETVYYFSTFEKDASEPLNRLLDFVQEFSVTGKSVEKEKGIIIEEVNMYKQQPVSRLLLESYRAMYREYPLIYDIGGDEESVNAITKEELETCYRINYHPSNMVLVSVSPSDPEMLLSIIKDNQKKKTFSFKERPEDINIIEDEKTAQEYREFKMPVNIDKQVIAYKLKPEFRDESEAFRSQFALTCLLEACFSSLNPDYQRWLDEGLINDFFGYELDFSKESAYVLFFAETDDKNVLERIIKEGLNLKNISEEILEGLKRKYIGLSLFNLNSNEEFALGFIKDILEGISYFEEIEMIEGLKLEDVEKSIRFVEKGHKAVINLIKDSQ